MRRVKFKQQWPILAVVFLMKFGFQAHASSIVGDVYSSLKETSKAKDGSKSVIRHNLDVWKEVCNQFEIIANSSAINRNKKKELLLELVHFASASVSIQKGFITQKLAKYFNDKISKIESKVLSNDFAGASQNVVSAQKVLNRLDSLLSLYPF